MIKFVTIPTLIVNQTTNYLYLFKRTSMKRLAVQLTELKSYLPKASTHNPAVSESTIGWQIAHSVKTILGIMRALEQSDATTYQWKFNRSRALVFAFEYIPRGSGKAPKVVQPKESDLEPEQLEKRLNIAEGQLKVLEKLDPKVNFMHPYFGQLNKAQAIKFLVIHTKHHLKIIRDILK